MTNRILHIDIARGIGILLIVFGHNWIVLDNPGELYRIIFSVHIPLFLILSGAFARTDSSFWRLAKDKADSLLKPYFVTLTIVALCLWWTTRNHSVFQETIFSMLYGSADILRWLPLWFLPHLFLLSICANLLLGTDVLKRMPRIGWGLVLGLMLVTGSYFARVFWPVSVPWFSQDIQLKGLPFGADLLLLSGFYFLLGYILRDQIVNFKLNIPLSLLCAAIFIGMHVMFDYTINLQMRRYEYPIISTIQTLAGVYLILFISTLVAHQKVATSVLAYMGVNSILLLIFHAWVQDSVFDLANTLSPRKFYNGVYAFLAAIAFCLILAGLINRLPLLKNLYRPIKRDHKMLESTSVAADPS